MSPAPSIPSFEQGPIRPPSEAHSLLVRVIRNCTWNRCTFCPVYKGTKSSQRPLEDVLADVEAMAACPGRPSRSCSSCTAASATSSCRTPTRWR